MSERLTAAREQLGPLGFRLFRVEHRVTLSFTAAINAGPEWDVSGVGDSEAAALEQAVKFARQKAEEMDRG
jgi:hypothetical protein